MTFSFKNGFGAAVALSFLLLSFPAMSGSVQAAPSKAPATASKTETTVKTTTKVAKKHGHKLALSKKTKVTHVATTPTKKTIATETKTTETSHK